MGFKKFLTEGKPSYDWNGYLLPAKYLSGRELQRYTDAINAFKNGIEDKEIYNAEFKDHYSYGFSRGYEQALEVTVSKVYLAFPHGSEERDIYDKAYWINKSPVGIKKSFKELAPFKNTFPDGYAILQAMQTFPDMLKELKGYIKSGRKPNEAKVAAQQKFQAMVSYGAAKRMAEVLRKSVEDIRPMYEKQFETAYMKSVDQSFNEKAKLKKLAEEDALKKHQDNIRRYGENSWYARSGPDKPKPWYLYAPLSLLVQDCYDRETDDRKPDWKAIVIKEAKDTVNEILEGFVAKNTAKLGAIVDKKQNMDQIKVLSNRLVGTNLENEILVTFSDGARFTVYSKTIWKRAPVARTIFTQYPTRFKDVVNSTGLHMAAPDEEKMNKEFH